jgi:DNA polymerase III subunit beta
MEFNIQRNTLLAGIRKTLGIVEKKTTMPILNNVLIRAKGPGITIIATDIEITLVAHYEADVLSEGDVTVSAKKLHEMIRETPESLVHVKKNDKNVVTISCEKAVYKINGLSAEEFPSIADDDASLFKVDRKIVSDLIAKTFFATSTDDTRVNLTGGVLEISSDGEKNILRMVATDGHRMAVAEYAVLAKEFIQLEKGVIIPRKGLMEIRKLVDESTGDAFLGIQKGRFVVKIAEVILRVNLIDAEFPDYQRVIPQEKGTSSTFDKDKILHALRRINVISSEGYGGVIVTIKGNLMVLTSNDPDVGEGSDEMEIVYGGDEIVVGYNVGYLLNAIEAIDEKDVILEIGGGSKPSLIKGEGNDSYFCIVMPLKI